MKNILITTTFIFMCLTVMSGQASAQTKYDKKSVSALIKTIKNEKILNTKLVNDNKTSATAAEENAKQCATEAQKIIDNTPEGKRMEALFGINFISSLDKHYPMYMQAAEQYPLLAQKIPNVKNKQINNILKLYKQNMIMFTKESINTIFPPQLITGDFCKDIKTYETNPDLLINSLNSNGLNPVKPKGKMLSDIKKLQSKYPSIKKELQYFVKQGIFDGQINNVE